jgi:hypothetical protein
VAVPQGGFLSGAGQDADNQWTQIPTPVMAKRKGTRKGKEEERYHGFGHSTRRTRVQGEPARWGTHKLRWAYHAAGRQTEGSSRPGEVSTATSRHDKRCHRTFCNAEGYYEHAESEEEKGTWCTYVTSLYEGERLAADKGIAIRGIGVLLPKIAGEKHGEVFVGGRCVRERSEGGARGRR